MSQSSDLLCSLILNLVVIWLSGFVLISRTDRLGSPALSREAPFGPILFMLTSKYVKLECLGKTPLSPSNWIPFAPEFKLPVYLAWVFGVTLALKVARWLHCRQLNSGLLHCDMVLRSSSTRWPSAIEIAVAPFPFTLFEPKWDISYLVAVCSNLGGKCLSRSLHDQIYCLL